MTENTKHQRGMEQELKFRLESQEQLHDLLSDSSLLGEREALREHRLSSRYFDSSDRRLRQARITLRLRRQDQDGFWLTCKRGGSSQGALQQRDEEELWLDEAAEDPNALPLQELEAYAAIRSALNGAELGELLQTDFRRRSCLIAWRNSRVELAIDQGLIVAGGRSADIFELELELKEGSLEELLAFGEALAAKHRLRAETQSKLKRGLILLDE